MKRKLNRKVLLILVLGLCLLGGGGYTYYVLKVRRTAAMFLDQARRAEDEGRFEDAAGLLANYLAYRPKDNEQRLRMGELLEKAGSPKTKSQALGVYARVLRLEPQRDDLRRRLVELAVEVNQLDAARPHLTELLKSSPGDPKWEYLLGLCAEAAHEDAAAVEWYDKARQHAPTQLDSSARLAGLLRRRLEQPERADQVMDEMIAANDKSFQAYLTRANYRRKFGSFEGWQEDVTQAQKLAPDETNVLIAAAELAQVRNDLDQARTLLKKALEREPKRPGLYSALSGVELQAGQL